MSKNVKVFYTGGWDSTFMLCKLSRKPITIVPIYILNPLRHSRDKELDSAKRIINLLSKHPNTKAKFSDIKVIKLSNISIDPRIRDARKRLSKKIGLLGYQYAYLAAVATKYDFVALGIESSPEDTTIGATATLNKYAEFKKTQYGYVVNQPSSLPDVNTVFGHMLFPIIDATEREMLEWIEKHGYEDIMKLTWFCHSPIKGQPCGLCRPCEQKMDSGMECLLPDVAKKRYLKAKKWRILGDRPSRSIKNAKIRLLGG